MTTTTTPPPKKLNVRQRRRKAQHKLHAAKWLHARLVGVDKAILERLAARTRINIHFLQSYINARSRP